jgi:hypothetical protein
MESTMRKLDESDESTARLKISTAKKHSKWAEAKAVALVKTRLPSPRPKIVRKERYSDRNDFISEFLNLVVCESQKKKAILVNFIKCGFAR